MAQKVAVTIPKVFTPALPPVRELLSWFGRPTTIAAAAVDIASFGLAAWQCAVLGHEMWATNDVSMTVQTPFYPFVYAIAFGCALLWLVILLDTIKTVGEVFRK